MIKENAPLLIWILNPHRRWYLRLRCYALLEARAAGARYDQYWDSAFFKDTTVRIPLKSAVFSYRLLAITTATGAEIP